MSNFGTPKMDYIESIRPEIEKRIKAGRSINQISLAFDGVSARTLRKYIDEDVELKQMALNNGKAINKAVKSGFAVMNKGAR